MAHSTLLNPSVRISSNQVVGGPHDGTEIVTLTFAAKKLCSVLVAAGVVSAAGVQESDDAMVSISWDTMTAAEIADKIKSIAGD